MDVDDCNGQSYMSVSGDSSMEREFSGGVGGPTVSTPNSKETSPHRSLSANSIKVELYSDEDPGPSNEDERVERVEEGGPDQGSTEAAGAYRELANHESIRLPNGKLKCDICGMICIGPNVLMVHKRSHTGKNQLVSPGERPFQCNQCGASFTQKGNLLRHIKLHSGEKPFKCPFCSYACRRRDALTGHLRTHAVSSPTVGKPYKCSYCARSYKQQSSLEEHLERCYNYLQSVESKQPISAQNAGQKHIRVSLGIAPYDNGETHPGDLEVLHGPGGGGSGGMVDTLQPLHLPTSHPPCLTELRSIHGAAHTPGAFSLGLDYTAVGPGGAGVGRREAAEGHEDLPVGRSSPSNGCQDSTDTESMPDEACNSTAPGPLVHSNNGHHIAPPPHYQRHSHAKDREMKREDGGYHAPPAPGLAPAPSSPTAPSRETLRVVDGEGRTVRCFRCDHCRVLFLDHVMFTIHMGCHGFRQPLECNICGHRSRDRYEFSSHIVRGEHILD
ncbi:zinc finger protein Eos-like isoform X3 [Nerophis lumbriciformis]|uniref:zinc finger protein Eos-like isoform X3 n=1 Tax=Nerophis lumbriciformis TaxID=546530 RepID=UPI003BA985D6